MMSANLQFLLEWKFLQEKKDLYLPSIMLKFIAGAWCQTETEND